MLADALRMLVGVAGTMLYLSLWNQAARRVCGQRRRLVQIAFLLLATPYILCLFWLMERFGARTPEGSADLTQWVDPLIGTDSGHEQPRGDTYPAAARPGGMTSWAPQAETYGSDLFYQHDGERINGLRATHQATVWLGDYGDFSLFPVNVTGRPGFRADQRGSRLRHGAEESGPEAPGASASGHRYVQAVRLNGTPLRVPRLTHADVTAGGTLTFGMGTEPNRDGFAPE